MKIHRWLDFKVTQRCNNFGHKCGYCDVAISPPSAPETLPLDTIHRTLLDARAIGFDTFWILGGEPSLREDAEHLFAPLSADPDIQLTVVTNGKERNDSMYRAIYDTSASRACVQVSFDTFEINNMKRADPAASLQLISDLKEMSKRMTSPGHQCDVEVHCVISRENWTTFDTFVRFFAAKRIPVSLAMVCPWRVVDSPVRFNEFSRFEMQDIASRINALKTELPVDGFNPVVADFINSMLKKKDVCRECGAGLTHVVINGDGGVYRCMAHSFFPSNCIGNILDSRLHSVLKSANGPMRCPVSSDCFDGYAWDRLALSK